jgi:hypothetical protein
MRGHEKLHAADFRTGTMFKNTVAMVHGHPRVFTTWGRCRLHALDQVCEEPQIVLTHFDNGGATWSRAWPRPHDPPARLRLVPMAAKHQARARYHHYQARLGAVPA